MAEHLMCKLSVPGRVGGRFPVPADPTTPLPEGMLRDDLPMPEMAEIDVIRYFTRLSQLNHSIDTGFYPLGSCTMKYNPKVNEEAARLPGFAFVHPLQPIETVQGSLLLMYKLQEWLKEIGGFSRVHLHPPPPPPQGAACRWSSCAPIHAATSTWRPCALSATRPWPG